MAKTFRDLLVWRRAHEWVLEIYRYTTHFPVSERFGLTIQLRRSAVSVPANIAEGFVRNGVSDKLRFMNISQSSLAESQYYLILCEDLGLGTSAALLEDLEEIGRLLGAYERGIRRNHRTTSHS